MEFRIVEKDSFTIMGLSGHMKDNTPWEETLWAEFLDGGDGKDGSGTFNQALYNKGNPDYYTPPLWQVGAYDFQSYDGKTPLIIGAEYKGKTPDVKGLSFKTVPAATWAVFPIKGATGSVAYESAVTRILTEWFPQSSYVRNEAVPHLDSYPGGKIDENYVWELWFPVIKK